MNTYQSTPFLSSAVMQIDTDLYGDFIEKIMPSELRVRHLVFNDSGRVPRSLWMNRAFYYSDVYEYSETRTSFISTVHSDFDVLVVGGMDAKRVARIVRQFQPLLHRKLLIALMNGSNAQRRAQVLSAGYDDAIDIEKVSYQEGILRVRAMWRRYQMRNEHERAIAVHDARLSELCDIARLSEREKRIMSQLQMDSDKYSTYTQLRRIASNGHEIIALQNLKVAICKLRDKLKDGVSIVAVPSAGYRLMDHRRR